MTAERTPVQNLRAARKRIESPERWTRGAYARDAKGRWLDSGHNPSAVCWCAVGSLQNEVGKGHTTGQGFEFLLRATPHGSVLDINDGPNIPGGVAHTRPRYAPRRHKEVLALYDRAIEAAEAKAK